VIKQSRLGACKLKVWKFILLYFYILSFLVYRLVRFGCITGKTRPVFSPVLCTGNSIWTGPLRFNPLAIDIRVYVAPPILGVTTPTNIAVSLAMTVKEPVTLASSIVDRV